MPAAGAADPDLATRLKLLVEAYPESLSGVEGNALQVTRLFASFDETFSAPGSAAGAWPESRDSRKCHAPQPMTTL